MASIIKLDDGRYRAFVNISRNRAKPFRRSKIFSTKREATFWAFQLESEFEEKETQSKNEFTLKDALRRYAKEISPTKKGKRWEQIRLAAFENDELPLDKPLHEVQSKDIAKFRDRKSTRLNSSHVAISDAGSC